MNNTAVTKNPLIIAVLAIVLALAQHVATYSSGILLENFNQNIWLVINLSEVVVMMLAWNILKNPRPVIARIIMVISLILLVAIALENFIVPLNELFWLFNSTLLMFGLILSAIYLLKNDLP